MDTVIVQQAGQMTSQNGEPFANISVPQRGSKERVLAMGIRQLLIMALGMLEDYLELPRSIVPRRKRE